MELDDDTRYAACKTRDSRFDGMFIVAVTSTQIYCRPSCPAITPKRQNVRFYRSAAAAQQNGFRACKRCQPDASPGSPEWNLREDLVGRAMRLIADGEIDRNGVDGLAERLNFSPRHLNRVLTDELGAGPLALARAQRAQSARTLIETSDLTMTEIAYAAGFGSVRQFNDTIQAVYATSPTELGRRSAKRTVASQPGEVNVRLNVRTPFAAVNLLRFLKARAVPGVEQVEDDTYLRSLNLPHGLGIVEATLCSDHVQARFHLQDWRDLAPAVRRIRDLFDLDADPVAVDAALRLHPPLRTLVDATPGLRVPGTVDIEETIIKAIVGQQISVAGARTVAGRLAVEFGKPLDSQHSTLSYQFPRLADLVGAPIERFPMPRSRAQTLLRVAEAVLEQRVDLNAERDQLLSQLIALKGIGPWTAGYIAMRALSDPDVLLSSDLVVRQALESRQKSWPDIEPANWRPWRSYAMAHLWNSIANERTS